MVSEAYVKNKIHVREICSAFLYVIFSLLIFKNGNQNNWTLLVLELDEF